MFVGVLSWFCVYLLRLLGFLWVFGLWGWGLYDEIVKGCACMWVFWVWCLNVLEYMFCMYMCVYRRVFGFDFRIWFRNDLGIVCGFWDSCVYGLDPGMIIVPGWSSFHVLVGCEYDCEGGF